MRLVRYEEIGESAYADYANEWESSGENVIPGAADRRGRSFAEMLEKWKLDESDAAWERFVPSTLYFLVDEAGKALGAIHLRHALVEKLRLHGGHIGYGVRPSERGKGYSTHMLKTLLATLRARGLDEVLLTCDDDNPPSWKAMESCGARLEDKILFEGRLSRRYWISTPARG